MNDHERLHIDGLVHEASDLLCETAIQRCAGPTAALRQLREDPNGEGVWLDKFVSMFLKEHALNTVPGACAILGTFEKRPTPIVEGGTVKDMLLSASSDVFTSLIRSTADQALERASAMEGVTA